MSEVNLSIKSMKSGLRVRQDEVNEPAGSFRVMRNAMITERGGVAKRPGISVIGDYDTTGEPVKGLFNYTKADGTEILVKALEATHKYLDTTWENIESGLTSSDHGYASHLVNTDEDDYLYYSSRDNGYKRWKGWFDRTTAILSGGETEIPVTTVLKADVHYSGTADSVTTTSIDIAGTPWGDDQWNGFYVYITSGAQSGEISLISDTDSNTITFATITGLSGTPTFDIRQLDVPATGTILVGGTSVAYTGVTNKDSLTVASAPAAASGSAVVLVQTDYPKAPRGNALSVWLTKMLVANIKSAVINDGGVEVATAISRAVYIAKTRDATDFSFSAPRAANEGDVIEIAYGGGRVLDVIEQEEVIYAGTPNTIEEIEYIDVTDPTTGTITDTAKHRPVKPGIGMIGKFIRGKDDVYFFTPAGELTSIGRVQNVDTTPQTLDIGFPVRRLLEDRVNDRARGLEYRNRLHMTQKLNSESTHNDRILVYNRGVKAFEGDWLLPANELAIWDDKPCFGQSNGSNILQMYDGEVDTWDGVDYPIVTEVKSNRINITPSGMEDQSLTGVHVAGYIRGNSAFDFNVFADYSEDPALTVNFTGSESDYVYNPSVSGSLGTAPLGQEPLATVDSPDSDGNYRFRFTVWFPDIYCNALSWGMKSYGKNEFVEINQVGFTVSADPLKIGPGLVKTI